MKAGAIDFLEKPYADHALLAWVEKALGRQSHPDLEHDIADAVRRVAMLSAREPEVMDGLPAGQPNKLIAYDLGISVRTLEVYRAPDVGAVRRASAGGRYPSRCYGDAGRQ
jgi:two-component system response regulator FixJ